jgi:hypothetical protein
MFEESATAEEVELQNRLTDDSRTGAERLAQERG